MIPAKRIFGAKNFTNILGIVIAAIATFSYITYSTHSAFSATPAELEDVANKIKEYEEKINRLNQQGDSLSKEIDILENNIQLKTIQVRQSEIQIKAKEEELGFLKEDIRLLEVRLDRLDETISYHQVLLGERLKQEYINKQKNTFLEMVINSKGMGDFVSQMVYLRKVQAEDSILLTKMDETKGNYEEQQTLLEEKKNEVEEIKKEIEYQKEQASRLRDSLEGQKNQKDELLRVTKNDEKRYQTLLAQAKTEYEALQGILSGSGIETAGEAVEKGQLVANVLQGTSCNSSGTHLHFMVVKDGSNRNPFEYLKPVDDYNNCSGAGSCSAGDKFNPNGDWDWPLKGTITMTQGYGASWATKNTWVRNIYSFHNGIDIRSTSPKVYAVEDGEYYRGYYKGSKGCRLQYVKIDHADKVSTYYLHVSY